MIYVQSNNKIPMWDFGSSALHGCLNKGKSYKLCEDWNMPGSDATCLIGSVEWCQKWLIENGHKVPEAINLLDFDEYLHRRIEVQDSDAFLETNKIWPIFIKPSSSIKAFTGTQVLSKFDAQCVLQGFNGELMVQEIIDSIRSEWRVYVNKGIILKCCQYKGQPLIYPNRKVVHAVVAHALGKLNNISFTLDFGTYNSNEGVQTFLIEPNDGWAMGNYGLEPEDYLQFCEDRWKQMIGK